MNRFSLITSPFIPCVRGGELVHLGLLETIFKAHKIEQIQDQSPLVTISLHRLLLAIIHRVIGGPSTPDDWNEIWQKKEFDAKDFEEYFQKWESRFNLFDENFPFYQDVEFQSKAPNGANQIIRELSRGNNATLFDHTHESPPPSFPAPLIARALIAEQMFAIGGGQSEIGYTSTAPAASGVLLLSRGSNLFETLMLNLFSYGPENDGLFKSNPDDLPAWEKNVRPSKDKVSYTGYIDYLTWQSRTIKLIPQEDGSVQYLHYASGRAFKPPANFFEPMSTYRASDTESKMLVIRFSETKQLWRDSASLIQFSTNERDSGHQTRLVSAMTTSWIRELIDEGCLTKQSVFPFQVFGLCTDKAKVNFWRQELLSFPREYLIDPNLVNTLAIAIDLAEKVGQTLRGCVANFAGEYLKKATDKSPDKDRLRKMVDATFADGIYWSNLDQPFWVLVSELAGDETHRGSKLDEWFTKLYSVAVSSFQNAVKLPQLDGYGQRAAIMAEISLRKSLTKLGNTESRKRLTKQETA